MLPSPMHYNNHGLVTAKGKRAVGTSDARMSSFGFGRERMKKLHIDAILYKNIRGTEVAKPGPGSHNISLEWTCPTDTQQAKTTPQFSFSKSRKDSKEHFNSQTNKRRCLPGPG